jgi:hypothetical protein
MVRDCVINAAFGSWYPKGQQRLVESLKNVGFAGDILTWCNEPINEWFDTLQPYTIKLAAFHEAIKRGYQNILWLDCSVWAVRPLEDLFNIIENEGGYFWRNGWKLGQTSTDSDLDFAGWDRDDAMELDELGSGILGINMNDRRTHDFLEWFFEAKKHGVFGTSRFHNNGSKDPRFHFGRQDQTAATIAFHKAGFEKMYDSGVYTDYDGNTDVILKVRGM